MKKMVSWVSNFNLFEFFFYFLDGCSSFTILGWKHELADTNRKNREMRISRASRWHLQLRGNKLLLYKPFSKVWFSYMEIFIKFKLREVVRACLNLSPEQRPDITQITRVANQMHQHFQAIGNMSPVTPSPQEMQQSWPTNLTWWRKKKKSITIFLYNLCFFFFLFLPQHVQSEIIWSLADIRKLISVI